MSHVLVVDHDPTLLPMLQTLDDYVPDLAITVTDTAADAVRVLQKQPVDIIGIDITMQLKDGVNLLAYVLKQFPLTPVLVHAAGNLMHIQATFTRQGFTQISVIQKSFARDAYLTALRELQAGSAAEIPAPALPEPLPYDAWSDDPTVINHMPATAGDQTDPMNLPVVEKDAPMSTVQQALEMAMGIDGAVGVALVDYESGMALGTSGGGALNLEVAAAGNSNVIRAKMAVMRELEINDAIEDVLITLGSQYHLIRLLKTSKGLFLYLVLAKSQANLAMARHKLAQIESTLTV